MRTPPTVCSVSIEGISTFAACDGTAARKRTYEGGDAVDNGFILTERPRKAMACRAPIHTRIVHTGAQSRVRVTFSQHTPSLRGMSEEINAVVSSHTPSNTPRASRIKSTHHNNRALQHHKIAHTPSSSPHTTAAPAPPRVQSAASSRASPARYCCAAAASRRLIPPAPPPSLHRHSDQVHRYSRRL